MEKSESNAPKSFVLDDVTDLIDRRLPQGKTDEAAERVRRFMADGVITSTAFSETCYRDGDVWADVRDRSLARYLHGFIFFQDWPAIALEDSTGATARFARGVSASWESRFARGNTEHEMAFHDETTAQRMINLLALTPAFEKHLQTSEFASHTDFLDGTAQYLSDTEFHSAGNNHGMFQDLALLSYAVKATWRSSTVRDEYFALAEERLMNYFLSCFTGEGIHVENAPTYHLMISRQVRQHRDLLRVIGHADTEILDNLLSKAAVYATHAVLPSGKFPLISDSQQIDLLPGARATFDDDNYVYAASSGKSGTRPSNRSRVFPESGYAIYRSAWGDPQASFVYFSAAYNADYHKHSDDLSLYVHHRGLDLLAEAGPFGYNYADPLTKYAFSQFAHNNVVVDGVSVPRTDALADTVSLTVDEDREAGFRVTGTTGRLRGARHSRTVDVLESGKGTKIDVCDVIAGEGNHRYDMHWNIGSDVVPVLHGQGFELFHRGEKVMDLHFESDTPTRVTLHCGETTPRPLGWRFPKFGQAVPGNVVRIRFEGEAATIQTKIRFEDFTYRNRGLADVESGWKRSNGPVPLNYLQTPAKTAAGSKLLVVSFSAIGMPGDFTYNYKSSIDASEAAALYILDDFGDQGAYYLQDHGDRGIFDAVQHLIALKLKEAGLGPDRLVTVGSSKGGAAALLHGLAAGAGYIFAGAPQTRIGTFLRTPHPNVLSFMTGSTSDAAVEFLDDVLFDVARERGQQSRVRLLVGERDHHYKGHVLPFAEHLRALGRDVQVDVLPGLPHSEIGGVYRTHLQQDLRRLLDTTNGQPGPEPYPFAYADPARMAVSVLVSNVEGKEIAYRLYREGEVAGQRGYGTDARATWTDLPSGRYRVRIFGREHGSKDSKAMTSNWVSI